MENIEVTNQHHLIQALEGSVSPDDEHRKKCEEYLINFSLKEGSVIALMRVMSNFQCGPEVRLAASIRLKNHITSHWIEEASDFDSSRETDRNYISKPDRTFLLDNLYLCLVSAGPGLKSIRNQCYEILRHVMFNVEISDTKNLLASISTDLNQRSDSDRILCALSCLRKVMSKYEYHGSSQAGELNEVLTAYFGPLFSVAQDASKIGLNNDEAASLIHFVLKIYFSSALLTSPTIKILKESMGHWMGLIKYVMTEFINWQQTWPGKKDLEVTMFSELNTDDEDYLGKFEQFKCLKWSLRIINRFMSRHNSFTDDEIKHEFYSSFLLNNYSNDCLLLVLKLLKLESEYKLVLNNLTHHLVWTFLRHSLSVESHFHYLLKGHLKEVVGVYCLNTFKYTKEDVGQYEEDPETFIQSLSDVSFQFYSNRGSCSDFLKELVRVYTSESLIPIKEIITLGFENTDSTILYSTMCITGYVSDKLVKKYKSLESNGFTNNLNNIVNKESKNKKNKGNYEHLQIDGEELLEVKVARLLHSDDIWIRMRAAWLCGCVFRRVYHFRKFDNLKAIYLRLLELLADKELLVAVLSANATIELFRMENVNLQEIIVQSISMLLERLFLLMNRIELESVTSVLADIVDNYSHEVVPYAKDIIINIAKNLTKNMGNANSVQFNGDETYDEDERLLVRWSMLQTMNTVVKLLSPNTDSGQGNKDKKETVKKEKEMNEHNLVLELNNYLVIINTVFGLLKVLFSCEDEGAAEYLDEAALLLGNLVRLLDVAPVKNLLQSSGMGFSDFWRLFVQLLALVRSQGFALVADFGLVREPLVALVHRDPQGFQTVLDDFYRLCFEARSNGFPDESDDVLSDCLEVSLNNGALNKVYEPLLMDTSNRVVTVLNNYKRDRQDIVGDNQQLIRLCSLLVLYYYQNLGGLGAVVNNHNVPAHLKVVTNFTVNNAVYCTWKSTRKYCILACCTLVKNNITRVDNTSVVNVLVTLLQNAKNDKDESEDEYEYSDSDSDYEDYDDDDYSDVDSDWSEFEFDDSPLKGVCEMKLGKQVLMGLNESLEVHQLNRQQLLTFLNTI